MAENIRLSQGKKNCILFSSFDELASSRASSPFHRADAPWKLCILTPFLREIQLRCPPALVLGSCGKSPVHPVAVIAHTATVLLEGALGINGFDVIVLIFYAEYPQVQKFDRPV